MRIAIDMGYENAKYNLGFFFKKQEKNTQNLKKKKENV